MSERYFHKTLSNGMVILAERMPGVQSAAMTLLVPAGVEREPEGSLGVCAVLADLVLRGAGSRDSRQLTEHLDYLGLRRSSSPAVYYTGYSVVGVAPRVIEALATYADIVRRAHLPADGFAAARDLVLQELAGIDDEPRQKLLIKAREIHFPRPLGRNTLGRREDLQRMTLEMCREHYAAHYQAHGAVISVAGNIDFAQVADLIEAHFGDWQGRPQPPLELRPPATRRHHEYHKSEQTHIAVACPSIRETHPDYYAMRLAVEALGGGMSGRLFTEVREKRALAYAVSAGYASLKEVAGIYVYAGTTSERAQATLDTLLDELDRLSRGIAADELERARVGLKAAVIMQGESSSARSAAMAYDWIFHGRIRTLEEIARSLDAVTLEQVNSFLERYPLVDPTIVTLGPAELRTP